MDGTQFYEILVYLAILSAMAGIMVGWFGMVWMLTYGATAGAAALAIYALEVVAGLGAGTEGEVATQGVLFVEVVLLATAGWVFGRWRRNVE